MYDIDFLKGVMIPVKKLAIIIWVILGMFLLLAAIDILFPIIFAASVFLKAFEIAFEVLGTLLQFIIVVVIVCAILFYLFSN